MNPDVDSLKAKLRQIDEYQGKGLLRAEEAEAQRAALLRRLMVLVVPDSPAPRPGWRVRVSALFAVVILVGGVSAYLLSGKAGLRRRSEEFLAAGQVAAVQDEASRRERLERIRAGQSLAPDRFGRFAGGASAGASGAAAPASGVSGAAAPASAVSGATDAVAPLLSGRVALEPGFEDRVASDDAVFITVRLPGDPAGLPLAQMRVEVSNLPLAFDIGPRQLLGTPERFMRAASVVVSARVSKSGSGAVRPGDLVGTSAPVAPWSGQVRILIDQVVPTP